MSLAGDARAARQYDGESVEALAARWQLAGVHAYDAVGSTLDVAHALAPSAASGTLVIANEQTAGRGRHGRRWTSAPGAGVWLTLIERPTDARALDVIALRCGLYAAEALDELAGETVRVKWPNDLYVGDGKLAGILIETRWRGTSPEWVAIGFGLNVAAPDVPTGAGLSAGVSRMEALDELVPALRRAAAATRHLSDAELARWRERDLAVGRRIAEPTNGVVQGISANGELLVSTDGQLTAHRSGSLTFAEPLSCS
ncbi:MAG: biotin/acetyl-CoA-carboxylase ligase [Gemmatimonadetes bacterium]|nr:biotin/acetyl-CoA-carboxylase ligase [Gemmatimonadota bacterium]